MNEWEEFLDWLFDGDINSGIPQHLAKYNSKIHHLYAIRIFRNNKNLNNYLNKYLNIYDLFSLDKEELFYFLKKCVVDFGVNRRTIPWLGGYKEYKNKTFDKIKNKYPLLKPEEIDIFNDFINNSPNSENIKVSLGIIDDHKKENIKNKTKNKERYPLVNLVRENFAWIDL